MKPLQNTLYWLPRIVSLCFALFLSLFALDVFSEYSGAQVIVPLFIHLIPSLVLLAAVVAAWRYELVGAVVFVGFAVFYVLSIGFDRPWSWYATIALPALIIGILFVLNWYKKQNEK